MVFVSVVLVERPKKYIQRIFGAPKMEQKIAFFEKVFLALVAVKKNFDRRTMCYWAGLAVTGIPKNIPQCLRKNRSWRVNVTPFVTFARAAIQAYQQLEEKLVCVFERGDRVSCTK
eukprot:g61023.t1